MKTQLFRVVPLAGALSIAAIVGGAAYASISTTSATSKGDTLLNHTTGGINITPTGSVWTPIASISLPKGNYLVGAAGNLVNFGPSDYTRCDITVNGAEIIAVSTMVGNPNAAGNRGPASYLSPVAMTGAVSVTADVPATATLRCEHDTTNGAGPYWDNSGSMWAQATKHLVTGTF
jgi:hypothetical protein